jgi:hypothetical protein
MGIAIKERRAIVKELHGKYARMTKTQKRNLLDQIVAVQGYNRNYAARLLRGGHRVRRSARTGQGQRYGAAVHRALVVVWRIYDCICMSAATIDRLLQAQRKAMAHLCRSHARADRIHNSCWTSDEPSMCPFSPQQELWILHIYAHRRTPQCGLDYNMHAATLAGGKGPWLACGGRTNVATGLPRKASFYSCGVWCNIGIHMQL